MDVATIRKNSGHIRAAADSGMITLSETQLYLLTFIHSVRDQESYMELHASHISQEFKRELNNFLHRQ